MLNLKRSINALLVCVGIFAGSVANAQTTQLPQQQEQQQINVTDAELEKFAQAFQGIQMANQDAQRKMIAIVEGEDLEIKRFNEIHEAHMQNQQIEASKADLEKHERAVIQIEEIQPEIQAQMEEIITSQGLTVERFQQIADAMQTNPQLQQRLQAIMMG